MHPRKDFWWQATNPVLLEQISSVYTPEAGIGWPYCLAEILNWKILTGSYRDSSII